MAVGKEYTSRELAEKGIGSMRHSGKLVIFAVAAIALAAACFSWWFRWRETHRAAEFWGGAASRIVRNPDRVWARKVTTEASGEQPQRDATRAAGITNFRNALLQDASFAWQQMNSEEATLPTTGVHEMVLERDDDVLRLQFADDFRWLRYSLTRASGDAAEPSQSGAACVAPIADGLKIFIEEIWNGDGQAASRDP